MKGIILAGGSGTRLYPATLAINKQLLPIYDKPMIFFPLSVLMLSGIREILIISSPQHIENFSSLFNDGSALGLSINYAIQDRPLGIAQAFTIGAHFIGKENVSLILGDNIFYGPSLTSRLIAAREQVRGATIFAYHVDDPERYGVVTLDKSGNVLSIDEKPKIAKSNWAVTGLYFYDNSIVDIVKDIKPSNRGELEITDVNRIYLQNRTLKVELLGRGFAWLDTGTHESLLEAAEFVRITQKRQGFQIACLEEIAYNLKYISRAQLAERQKLFHNTPYGNYLSEILNK